MLKEGLLKENIDGEALLWAYNRLIFKQEKKKIAIITSSEITITSFLIDYIEKLSEIYSVTLILNIKDTKKFINLFKNKEIKLINLKILRGIDLIQDINTSIQTNIKHEQSNPRDEVSHEVIITKNSMMYL